MAALCAPGADDKKSNKKVLTKDFAPIRTILAPLTPKIWRHSLELWPGELAPPPQRCTHATAYRSAWYSHKNNVLILSTCTMPGENPSTDGESTKIWKINDQPPTLSANTDHSFPHGHQLNQANLSGKTIRWKYRPTQQLPCGRVWIRK